MAVLWCGWVITGCLWFSMAGWSLSPGHSTGSPWDLLKLIARSKSTADFEHSVVVCLDSCCQPNLFHCCNSGEGEWLWSLWNIYRIPVPGDPSCHPAPDTAQCPLSPSCPSVLHCSLYTLEKPESETCKCCSCQHNWLATKLSPIYYPASPQMSVLHFVSCLGACSVSQRVHFGE